MRPSLRFLHLAALLVLARFAWADPISSGIWYEFYWDSHTGEASFDVPTAGCVHSPFCPILPPSDITFTDDPPWTFTAGPSGALFTITDVSIAGDSFDVFDFGSLILATPSVFDFEHVCGVSDTDYVDPAVCINDPSLSHGLAFLAPGPHSITITARDAPFGDGVGDFIVQSVPEPSTGVLSAAVIMGWAVLRRRRAQTSAPNR